MLLLDKELTHKDRKEALKAAIMERDMKFES